MKKLLSMLGAITLIGITSTNFVDFSDKKISTPEITYLENNMSLGDDSDDGAELFNQNISNLNTSKM